MNYSPDKLDRQTLERALAARPGILFAILYGSAAEGGEFRDVDVAVYVDRAGVPETDELDYAADMAALLEKALSLPVDVRVINDAPLPFRYNVSRGIPLAIHDVEAYYAFRERAWDEYLDFEPVAMLYLKEML